MTEEKITLPLLEAKASDGKNLFTPKQWLERFRQYIKRKHKVDTTLLIREEPMTDPNWNTVEKEVQEDFIWGVGPEAIYQITRAEYKTEPDTIPIDKLIKLFNQYYLPKRNIYHNRGDFFWAKQLDTETPEDFWRRLIDIEKECSFEGMTSEELLISKFMNSITDKKLRDKLMKQPKADMKKTIELIKQDTYDRKHKKNTIPEALISKQIKEEPIQRVERDWKQKPKQQQQQRKCRFCDAPNWNSLHKCPAKLVNCNKCGKKGHYAKVCNSGQRIKHIKEPVIQEQSESEPESESSSSINHIKEIKKIEEKHDHFTMTVKINGSPKKFIVDTGSPVTIMPMDKKILNTKDIQKINNRYQDINKNEVKFLGKIMVETEYENNKPKLPILITERTDVTPLIGMDWLKQFRLTIGNIRLAENNQSEHDKIFKRFHALFNTNETIKNTEVKIQLKPGHTPTKQKARPIPLHLQDDVENEIKRLIKTGHLEKIQNVDEDCFVSPVVITVKKDKTVKIALDSRKLNDSCIKMRPHMPNMEELINQISNKITSDRKKPLWISKIDLDYAYGQLKLAEETSKHCVFALTGGKFNGYYRFKKGFYGLADIPTIFQEKIDRTLEYCTPAWLDDIIVVTRGERNEHEKELFKVLNKLQDAGYRASKKKSELFMKKTIWLGNEIDENGIKSNTEKVKAILDLREPENTKQLKSFLGATQYLAKF